MRRVDDLDFPLRPKPPRRKPPDDPAHGRVAVQDVVLVLDEQTLKLPVRADIAQAERASGDGDGVLIVAVLNPLLTRRAVVHPPPPLAEPPHIGAVELGKICRVGEKEDFVHSMKFSIKLFCYKPHNNLD